MKKKISWFELIIIVCVILVFVKGYNYWNKPEKVSEVTPVPPKAFVTTPISADIVLPGGHVPTANLIDEGIYFLKIYNYDKAIDCFSCATNGPQAAEAWAYTGYALLKQEEFRKALSCIEKALEINSDMVLALNQKGEILWFQGKKEEAIKYNEKVLEINPLFPDAIYNKGVYLYYLNGKKNIEERFKYMDKAMELAPDYAALQWGKGNFLHYHLHKPEEAIECYDKALELDSYYFQAWYDKGMALYQLDEQSEEIIRLYDEALEDTPDNYAIWYAEGLFYKNCIKNLIKAIECFNKALEFNPGFYEVQQELENKSLPYKFGSYIFIRLP